MKKEQNVKKVLSLIESFIDKQSLKEGTWAYPKSENEKQIAQKAIKELEDWKTKYYNTLGDDEVFNGIDNAITRSKFLLNLK